MFNVLKMIDCLPVIVHCNRQLSNGILVYLCLDATRAILSFPQFEFLSVIEQQIKIELSRRQQEKPPLNIVQCAAPVVSFNEAVCFAFGLFIQ